MNWTNWIYVLMSKATIGTKIIKYSTKPHHEVFFISPLLHITKLQPIGFDGRTHMYQTTSLVQSH